jgi:general secretion pathway protein C
LNERKELKNRVSKSSKRSGTTQEVIAPWGQKYWPLIFFLFLGLFTADIAILSLRDKFLPLQAPLTKPARAFTDETPGRGAYQTIITRNIFSSDNVIPDPLKSEGKQQLDLPPVLSSLPLNLIGTLVHSNPEKSIASIELKGKSQVLSYMVKQDVDNLATIEKIERGRVILRNNNNGRLEYIELPQSSKLAFESAKPTGGTGEIKQISEGQYELKKQDLDKYLSDLPNLLMQARAVPARRPGTGETYGFRVLEVQPDSVLAKIVKPMDVITQVNGGPVTSIQQAMEMYNTMKNSPHVCITVERDGRNVQNCYDIK